MYRMAGNPERAWCDAMECEDGAGLISLLTSYPWLVSLNYCGYNALHLALRKSWYGLVYQILRKFDHLRASPCNAQFSPSESEKHFFDIDIFRDLLTAKEGQTDKQSNTHRIWGGRKPMWADRPRRYVSGLDVFAMAVIRGNMAINVILAEAVCAVDELFHKGHPYKKVISALPSAVPDNPLKEISKNRKQREKLRQIMADCFRTDVKTTCDDVPFSSADRVINTDSSCERSMENQMYFQGDTERYSEASSVAPTLSSAEERDSQTFQGFSHYGFSHYNAQAVQERRRENAERGVPSSLEDIVDPRWWKEWRTTSPFLPLEEFLFLICCRQEIENFIRFPTDTFSEALQDRDFLEYVREISDTQATAMVYAFRFSNYIFLEYLVPTGDSFEFISGSQDSLGRTASHIFSALGDFGYLYRFHDPSMFFDESWDEKAIQITTVPTWDQWRCQTWEILDHNLEVLGLTRWNVDVATVSEVNGYWRMEMTDVTTTPFDLAMCSPHHAELNVSHASATALELLNSLVEKRKFDFICSYTIRRPVEMEGIEGILQFAAYIGNAEIVQLLANDDYVYDMARFNNKSKKPKNDPRYSALHVAAIAGQPEIIRIILATRKFDAAAQDLDGNTPLHLATYVRFSNFSHTLTDFVEIPKRRIGISFMHKDGMTPEELKEMARLGESNRKGCINLLVQEGVNVWKTNIENETPYPGPEASPEYISWWYDKRSRETQETRTKLNITGNAILVTASLVATASYVGPLQPPLGYAAQTEGPIEWVQVEILSVRMFIVFNTLAFYFALGAIMMSLPIPQLSTRDELRITRLSVKIAWSLMVISIMSLLAAFASATLSIVSNDGSWNYLSPIVTALAVGAITSLSVLVLSLFWLSRLLVYQNKYIRDLVGELLGSPRVCSPP